MSETREAILQDAIDAYVAASIFEADEAALEAESGVLFGPRTHAAKQRLQAAYERLYSLSGRSRDLDALFEEHR